MPVHSRLVYKSVVFYNKSGIFFVKHRKATLVLALVTGWEYVVSLTFVFMKMSTNINYVTIY